LSIELPGIALNRASHSEATTGRSPFRRHAASLVPLFFDEGLELALHRFKGVIDYFAQRLVHLVLGLLFFRDKLVAWRHGHVDANPEWISGMLRMIGMLDDDIAAADVIAKPIESRGFGANVIIKLVCFFDAAIRDFDR
jgi:hypothetical protein